MADLASLHRSFAKPSRAFGPLPFWWWIGAPMTRQRVAHQLERLDAGGVGEACVIHLCPDGPAHGIQEGSDPRLFSEAWWELFRYALEVAEGLGMRLWLHDQIGVSASNWFVPVLQEHPEWRQRTLHRLRSGEELPRGAEVLDERGGWVYCHTPVPEYPATHANLLDFLQPEAGAVVLDRVHGELERRIGHTFGRVFAGTFQDELRVYSTWAPGLAEAFRKRDGRALMDVLPELWAATPETSRARANHRRALADLAEEAFFRPLGAWHDQRGLLVGFDQHGPSRSGDPVGSTVQYHDYTAVHRWLSAPGNDHHGETKLHSSLAHHYGRPRVWLEAFHSSGWGGTLEETFHWLLPFLQQGATLYNPHAVFTSVKGGWWEWASPSTCWRQPYWPHYPRFTEAVARLCWFLSQGQHVADIAVVYPAAAAASTVTPEGEGEGSAAVSEAYWDVVGGATWRNRRGPQRAGIATHSGVLNTAGYDFDLVDEASLAAASLDESGLRVAEESFSTLILPRCILLDRSSLERALALAESGGTVIVVEALPASTTEGGADDPELTRLLGALLGSDPTCPSERAHPGGGLAVFVPDAESMLAVIEQRVLRDVQGEVYALRRRVDGGEIYFVASTRTLLPPPERDRRGRPCGSMQAPAEPVGEPQPEPPESAEATFRSVGAAQQWDPWTGEARCADVIRTTETTTTVRVDFTESPGALVIFGQGLPEPTVKRALPGEMITALDGAWECEVIPPGDNDWGDFAWPPHAGPPPVEIRTLRYRPEQSDEDGLASGWSARDCDDGDWSTVTTSFGPYVEVAGTFEAGASPPAEADWRPYRYSQRLGMEGDPVHRGLLGPKGHLHREFLDLGPTESGRSWFVRTCAWVPEATTAQLVIESGGSVAAWVGQEPVGEGRDTLVARVELAQGWNRLLLRLDSPGAGQCRGAFFFAPAETRPPFGHPLPDGGWLTGEPTGPFVPDMAFDPEPEAAPGVAWYRTVAPPGADSMTLVLCGTASVFVDGNPIVLEDGRAALPDPAGLRRVLALRVELPRGVREGAAFPLPLRFNCGQGTIEAGEWQTQGLPHHAGGVVYRRTFTLDQVPSSLWLDLGAVRGTAEVRLNDSRCGVRIWRPYRFDLTASARVGANRLEIDVRNTLGPHFGEGHPSAYTFQSQASSGLFGPVRLCGE